MRAYISLAAGLSITIPLYLFFKSWFRRYIIEKSTAIYDLPNLGKLRKGKRIQGTVVVSGGSVAGLWAARVCADHFEDVLIVDSEAWLGTEAGSRRTYDADGIKIDSGASPKRTRVMQYDLLHTFPSITYPAMQQIYPDVKEEFEKSDVRMNVPFYNVHNDGRLTDRFPYWIYPNGENPMTPFVTRETFELTLRRVIYKPGGRIRWMSGTVTGFKCSTMDSRTIKSVSVRRDDIEEEIPAALVIDCTGQGQMGFKCLKRLVGSGSQSLDDYAITFDPKVRYNVFRFPVPLEMRARLPIPGGYDNATVPYAYIPLPPTDYRVFVLNRLEGHRIEVCCGGWGEPELPEGIDAIIPWLKSLNALKPVPDWVMNTIEILNEIEESDVFVKDSGRIPPCMWIQYEKMGSLPSNFIATGDAVMRLNPLYGQGCAKACVGALTLNNILRTIAESQDSNPILPLDFSTKFFKKQADKIRSMWDGMKPIEYGYETTIPVKGETLAHGRLTRIMLKYIYIILEKGDDDIQATLYRIRLAIAPGIDMMHPKILIKILLAIVKRYLGLI